MLLPDGATEIVAVPDGLSMDEALEQIMGNIGHFSGDWVHLRKAHGAAARYVRYDQIIRVEGKSD
jgi:hypothetical protein